MKPYQLEKLEKSFATRDLFCDKPEPYNVQVMAWPAPWKTDDLFINLSFNIGRNSNKEIIHLKIHPTDFAQVVKTMMDADREAALKAFAEAILSTPPD